jgi:hypothetical protein
MRGPSLICCFVEKTTCLLARGWARRQMAEAGNVEQLSENQEHKEHLEKVMAHWSPPSQAYMDYCKEIDNELPRAFELTHAEMANVELHLALGGNRAKAFEIIQEAGKRWPACVSSCSKVSASRHD